MKPFVVDTNSWHYKVVMLFNEPYDLPDDFCSYWRMFFTSSILSVIFTCFLLAFVSAIGFLMYKYGELWFNEPKLALFGTLCISLFSIIYFGYDYITKFFKNKTTKQKQSGIFKTKYKTWKEKICPMVVYEKDCHVS